MRILKKKLNITFTNPNTEEQIVQAISGVLAHKLAEQNPSVKFDYTNSQNSRQIEEDELEI